MHVLGVIPARGGSTRIPRKNIALCAGRPLLYYSCREALTSAHIDRVILTTDDPEIAGVGRDQGVEVFMRSPELSQSDTPMLPVVIDVLDRAGSAGKDPDAVVLLQPTSPLRRARHIDEAVALFLEQRPDSVVSVVRPPHIFHPLKLVRATPSGLVPYQTDQPPVVGHRDLPDVFAKNGPAVLVMAPEVIRSGSLYGRTSLPYLMDCASSVDVDEQFDLDLAEFILLRQKS